MDAMVYTYADAVGLMRFTASAVSWLSTETTWALAW
jgi:hypothetical protein